MLDGRSIKGIDIGPEGDSPEMYLLHAIEAIYLATFEYAKTIGKVIPDSFQKLATAAHQRYVAREVVEGWVDSLVG